MSLNVDRKQYANILGPTAGDKIRLGDTEIIIEIEKDFRGSHLHIVVKNPGHAESGCEKLFVNGEQMKDNYIPQEKLTKTTEVELFLS